MIWRVNEDFIHITEGGEQAPFASSLLIWVLRSQGPQPTLSSLWAPLEGLCTGPWYRLHKVVGDLPLVFKQVFGLCAVCITCVTSVHVRSVAVVFTATSHDIVHEV